MLDDGLDTEMLSKTLVPLCSKKEFSFLDKLEMKVLTPEEISEIADEDEYFQGFVINPHSQNFNMDRNGSF